MKKTLAIVFIIGCAFSVQLCCAQEAQPKSAPGAASTSAAQPAPSAAIPPDQQATKEQVEKFFEVMRLHKQMENMMSMMPKIVEESYQIEMKHVNEQLPPGKRLMPQDQTAVEKVFNKYMERAMTVYSIDDMIADAVPVYQRHISKSDMDVFIAFYSSAPGQRLLDQQPAIMSEYMAILMPHIQDRSKALTDEMQAEIQQIVKPELINSGKSTARPE